MSDCWCSEVHDYETGDPQEAVRNIWHLLIADLRIPQFVDWLAGRLAR